MQRRRKPQFAHVIHLPDEASTRSLGKAIARRCTAAMAVLLYGPLGAGKTTFAQGFVAELTGERATSPTFVIAHRHAGGRASVCHLDLYRLSDADMCADIDLDSYLDADSIAIVEWPERAGAYAWPPDRIEIRLSLDKSGRAADLQARGRCAAILDSVLAGWAPAPG